MVMISWLKVFNNESAIMFWSHDVVSTIPGLCGCC